MSTKKEKTDKKLTPKKSRVGTLNVKSVAPVKVQITFPTNKGFKTVSLIPEQTAVLPDTVSVKEVVQRFINQGLIIYTK